MKIVIISILVILSFAMSASADVVNIKYDQWDSYYGIDRLIVTPNDDITLYVENYYVVDSNGNPKFYSSGIRYSPGQKTFVIQRPNARYGDSYKLVETMVITKNKVTIHWWTDLRIYW